jgi:FkbM family methyltransferase
MFIKLIIKLLSIFDFFQKKKIINFFKNQKLSYIDNFFDIGSHYGETIIIFKKNFKINNIYSFEASPVNFRILCKKINNVKQNNINLFNLAVGRKKTELNFNQSFESQSSTFLNINLKSKYLDRKRKFLFLKNDQYFQNNYIVKMINLKSFIKEHSIKKIDILKIDTEGYDFEVILGLGEEINKVKFIYFEHHFHDMFIKKYKFREINQFLVNNNFKKIYKIKMSFRKTFEYIYYNRSI